MILLINVFKSSSGLNIVLIVTDDQDVVLNGMNPMKKTLKHLADNGITAINAFTSSPICCPSRASILTGMYAHNHATINNSITGGCYDEFWTTVIEKEHTFSRLLQNTGYDTFYAGKYLNEYKSQEIPDGWTDWYGLHGNSRYFNYTLNENGKIQFYEDEYLTDVLKEKALQFIENHKNDNPFFMMISPPAPHAPFTPAERHKNEFSDLKAPRTPNFDTIAERLDKHWLLRMHNNHLPDNIIKSIDLFYRKRWQTLLAVDELVDAVVNSLTETEQINNTLIIFTSDNGYHLGQFGQPFDKRQPYDTDIRVPLILRGPEINAKTTTHYPIALIDLAPTILDFAGIEIPNYMDGESFKEIVTNHDSEVNRINERIILIEYWGEGTIETYNPECPWSENDLLNQCTPDADCRCQDSHNNTYICVRHVSKIHNKIYCEFNDDEYFAEAYDLSIDPYQLSNQGFDWPPSLRAKYSLLLYDMAECVGKNCSTLSINI